MKKKILICTLAAVLSFASGLVARAAATDYMTGEPKVFVSMITEDMAE